MPGALLRCLSEPSGPTSRDVAGRAGLSGRGDARRRATPPGDGAGKTATELYLDGSDKVKYFYGENPGDHGGITNDLVCCSDYPSKMFDTALELGSTTGFFCGHDHYNNASIEYKGIRLTYGMSIDYLAMPGIEKETKQRGAELITIHADSSWESEQIPLESIT